MSENDLSSYHGDIGRAMEVVYKDALEERSGSLAEHFKEGGDYEKAAQYFHLSARKARRASAYIEAIAFARNEVSCLEKSPMSSEVKKRIIDARVTLSRFYQMLNHYSEGKDAVAPVIDLAHGLDYRRPAIYVAMAGYLLWIEERIKDDKERQYLTEAKRLALEENDYLSLWMAYYYEGITHGWCSEFSQGESCLAHCIEMAQLAGDVHGLGVGKHTMALMIYGLDGRIDEALRCSQEALQLAIQADDLYLKGGAYLVHGYALFLRGSFPDAEENMMLGLGMSQKTDWAGSVMIAFMWLGILRSEMGRYREAQECFDGVVAVHERLRINPSMARVAQIKKVAAGIIGCLDPVIEEVLNFDINEIISWLFQGMAAHAMGEIFLHIDDTHMDEAEVWIKKAIETNKRYRMPWYLAKDYALYADFFKKKSDRSQARVNLRTAIEIFRQCSADGWVTKYEEELARL